MEDQYKQKIINKFFLISDNYHKLSLLLYELGQSIKIESQRMNTKELKQYIKSLDLDIEKLQKMSRNITEISLKTLTREVKE